jgi:predicted SAM-dependent methyltransferase
MEPFVKGMKALNLGCGDRLLDGYVNVDKFNKKADVIADAKFLPFKNNSFDIVDNCHVIEHFGYYEGWECIKEWNRVLKIGGKLCIETPELVSLCKRLVELEEKDRLNCCTLLFGQDYFLGQAHKFLYTEYQLKSTMEMFGFRIIDIDKGYRYIGLEKIMQRIIGEKIKEVV